MPKVKAAEVYIPVTTTAGKATSDIKGLNRELKKTDKTVKQTSKTSTMMGTALGIGVAGGAALAASAMFNLVKESIAAASAAEETENKFNVVFSSISNEANKTAVSIANAFGLSQEESQRLLSNTGDLLTGFGMSQKAAFKMSSAVTELAADLASFNNLPTKQASEALTKALLGERESIKTLGIAIRESDIQRQLAIRGTKGLTGEALMQEKAIITLNLAMKQSGNALGDFQRSQHSMANQAKITNARIADFKAGLGKPFTGALAGAMQSMNDLTGSSKKSGEAIGKFITDITGLSKLTIISDLRKLQIQEENLREKTTALKDAQLLLNTATEQGVTDTRLYKDQVLQATDAVNLARIANSDYYTELKKHQDILKKGGGGGSTGGPSKDAAARWKALVNTQKSAQKTMLDSVTSSFDLEREAQDKLLADSLRGRRLNQEQIIALNAIHFSKINEINLRETQAEDERRKKELEKERQHFQAKAELAAQYAEIAITIGESIANSIFANQQFAIDEEQRKHDRVIELAEREKKISEAGTEAEKKALADGFAFQDKIAKKRRKLAHDQAIAEKIFGILQAGIATGVAITKALPNIPLAIAVGILGAAEVASIASTPIPKAAFGGEFTTIPPAYGGDSALMNVSAGEEVSVTPAREAGSNMPQKSILMVGDVAMDAYIIDKVNQIMNEGDVIITRKGALTKAIA